MNINSILAQQIKDLQPKPIPFIQPNASNAIQPTGMEQHCYNVGVTHATNTDPTPVVDGVDALPCTLAPSYNDAYTQGFIDGLNIGQ